MGRDTFTAVGLLVKLISRQGLMLETQLEIQAPSLPLQGVGHGCHSSTMIPTTSFPLSHN